MYCSIQDIKEDLTEKVVAQLSNDENPNEVNEEIVSKYISESTQLIDGFLRSRYGLPLEKEHSIIKKICIDIVKYELYKRRGKVFDNIQNLYKDGITTLEKIQKGMIILDEGTPETRPGFFLVSDRKPVIDKDILENY
jgi:phage gp36-like protein